MKEIKDQFKNEFQSEILEGNSFYIDDAAEKPLGLVPYGEPVQEVIEEELGTTVEGESVVVSDGNPEKEVKDVIYGMSKQNTTEGYNKLKILESKTNNYFSFDKDTSILTLNGTLEANGYAGLTNVIGAFPSGEYTIVVEYISGSIQNASVANIGIGSQEWATGGVNISGLNSSNPKIVKKVTLGDTNNNLYSQCGVGTYNNFKARLWVASGTYTLSTIPPYEPYTNGASPNTEYKQDIEVIDGVNILNPANVNSSSTLPNTLIEKTRYRLTSSTLGNALIFKDLGLKKGTYTVSIQIVSGDYQGGNLVLRNSENASAGEVAIKGTKNKISLVVKDNDINSLVLWQVPAGTDIVYDIQIEPGEKSSVFLPYGHIGLIQRGKNYFDINTVKRVADGTITDNIITSSSLTGWGLTRVTFDDILLKANVTYYISMLIKKDSGDYARTINTVQINTDRGILNTNSVKRPTLTSEYSKSTFSYTPTIDTILKDFLIQRDGGDSNSIVFSVKDISLSDIDDEYEPYIEPIVHEIDLAGNSIAKTNDNIRDLLKIATNGDVSLTKKTIGIYGKNISQSSLTSNGKNRFTLFNTKLKITDNNTNVNGGFSNICSLIGSGKTYNGIEGFTVGSGGALLIYLEELSEMTLAEAKAKLEELGAYFLLPLQEEYYETINLPSIEPIKLFEGTNVFELVTNLGTTMALTYDYVTPSPSIDRPSEILTVQGDYETKKQNKNFFTFEALPTKTGTSIGVNYEYIKNKLKLNGTTTGTGNGAYIDDNKLFTLPKGKYNINVKISGNMETTGSAMQFSIRKDARTSGAGGKDLLLFYTKTNTAKASVEFDKETDIFWSVYTNGAGIVLKDFTIEIQIEHGETSTEIVEPQGTTLPLTLSKELLGEIVTLTEEEADALKLDGAGKYRRTDYVTLNGADLNWKQVDNTSKSDKIIRFSSDITNIKTVMSLIDSPKTMMCNVFDCVYILNAYTQECIAPHNGLLNQINIFINKARLANETIEDFKQYLSEINCVILAKLQTPTYEKITDETELAQLKEYDKQIAFFGINNINTYPTDNLVKAPLGLKVTYDKSNRIL